MITTSGYQNARFKRIEPDRILSELDKKNIVIITGFQGVNRYGDPTTLGRGASDTSAVALAAALSADLCEIYTDVDGVFTADPRIVPDARKLDEIGYGEMLELASLGAIVLQKRSVELAKRYNVKMVVRSSMNDGEGTKVKEDTEVENMVVTGVAVDDNVARITIVGVEDEPGAAFRIFSLLAKNKISVDIIVQAVGKNGKKDISFTVEKDGLHSALKVLEDNKAWAGYESVAYNDGIAKLSVVGAGMAHNPGVASEMFEALYNVDVNIGLISTSEIKISVLIDAKDAKRGALSVHKKFFGSE
jgi:aspartate kinase